MLLANVLFAMTVLHVGLQIKRYIFLSSHKLIFLRHFSKSVVAPTVVHSELHRMSPGYSPLNAKETIRILPRMSQH